MNLLNDDGKKTIEIRMKHGSTDHVELEMYIKLMGMFLTSVVASPQKISEVLDDDDKELLYMMTPFTSVGEHDTMSVLYSGLCMLFDKIITDSFGGERTKVFEYWSAFLKNTYPHSSELQAWLSKKSKRNREFATNPSRRSTRQRPNQPKLSMR